MTRSSIDSAAVIDATLAAVLADRVFLAVRLSDGAPLVECSTPMSSTKRIA